MKKRQSTDTPAFYDDLAAYYDLIFENWGASIERQAEQLDAIIQTEWGGEVQSMLDAAAGIGTQSLGLAALGYMVTASDLSTKAIERTAREAAARHLTLTTTVADLRHLSEVHDAHDLVLVCDNSLPHLLTDDEILQALRECFRCANPGGGCLVSLRDYPTEPPMETEFHPYGVRERDGRQFVLFQVWDWDYPHYDLTLYVVQYDAGGETQVHRFRIRYYAVSVERVEELMREAGFTSVRRADGYYQPVLVGTRPAASC